MCVEPHDDIAPELAAPDFSSKGNCIFAHNPYAYRVLTLHCFGCCYRLLDVQSTSTLQGWQNMLC